MMRLLLLLTLAVAAIIWLAAQAGAAECLGSAGEVHKEHPKSWATWRMAEGHKCWSEDHRRKHHTKVARPAPHERSYARAAAHDTLRSDDREYSPPWKMAERWTLTYDQPEFERLRWIAGVGR